MSPSGSGLGAASWRCVVVAAALLAACSPSTEQQHLELPAANQEAGRVLAQRELEPPVGDFSMAPNLLAARDSLWLSWLEPRHEASGQVGHRLLVASWTASGWSAPATVAEGDDFFANWADLPAVAAAGDGTLFAHWLAKTAEETYAYSIFVARSPDHGLSWHPLGPLNDDGTPTEHGFVSYTAEDRGVRAFWLDGRGMLEGRPMALRTAIVAEAVGPPEVLDERVCECCSTAATRTESGPLVVFRDRSADEIRDIGIVRRQTDGWTATAPVHPDGWEIAGCPVNGPEVAAAGQAVVVAWFTAAEEQPRVKVAFSSDGGASFGDVRVVDEGKPLGRVGVVLDGPGQVVVSWLEATTQGEAEIRLRRVHREGAAGPATVVSRTSAARASGFPRLARLGERLYVAWVETDGDATSRVRVHEIPLASV